MTRVFRAPGRVNLIGDHTDYSGGLVLPAAIDRGLLLRVEPAEQIVLDSLGHQHHLELAPDGSGEGGRGWGRYVSAVAAELAAAGRPPVGMAGALESDLPEGAGLSSSAALEVVIAVALCAVADFHLEPMALADLCRRAEQRAVGVPCGIMDQAASLLGGDDAALLLDCTTLEHQLVPLPGDLALLVFDSGVPRRLEESGYAQRRAELEEGLPLLRGRAPADVHPDELDALLGNADTVPARRVRHVVTENERVRRTVAALRSPADHELLGQLFAASHASLRNDFAVTIPETDALVMLCADAGAVAARMTGGGFGGAIVALVEASQADDVAAHVLAAYRSRCPDAAPEVLRCRAAAGAGELPA